MTLDVDDRFIADSCYRFGVTCGRLCCGHDQNRIFSKLGERFFNYPSDDIQDHHSKLLFVGLRLAEYSERLQFRIAQFSVLEDMAKKTL